MPATFDELTALRSALDAKPSGWFTLGELRFLNEALDPQYAHRIHHKDAIMARLRQLAQRAAPTGVKS